MRCTVLPLLPKNCPVKNSRWRCPMGSIISRLPAPYSVPALEVPTDPWVGARLRFVVCRDLRNLCSASGWPSAQPRRVGCLRVPSPEYVVDVTAEKGPDKHKLCRREAAPSASQSSSLSAIAPKMLIEIIIKDALPFKGRVNVQTHIPDHCHARFRPIESTSLSLRTVQMSSQVAMGWAVLVGNER